MKLLSSRALLVVTALSITAGHLTARVPLLTSRRFDPDEFEHMHVAWSILEGQVPYRDFFEHHTPLFHYLLAALVSFFEVEQSPEHAMDALFAARHVMWALGMGILACTFVLARRLRDTTTALVALPLLAGSIVLALRAIEIRPDGLSTLLWLGSLIAFHAGLHGEPVARRTRVMFALAGVMIGLAVLVSQKLLLAGPPITLLAAWYVVSRRFGGRPGRRLANVVWQSTGVLIVWLAAIGWFALNGAAGDFLELTLLGSLGWKAETSASSTLAFIMKYEPWLFGLAAGGTGVLLRGMLQRNGRLTSTVFLLVCAVGLFLGLFVVPVPYAQYCLTFMPLFAIIAASLLVESTRALAAMTSIRGSRPSVWAATTLLVVIGFSWFGLRVASPVVVFPFVYPAAVAAGVGAALALPLYRRPEISLVGLLFMLSVLPVQWSRWMFNLGDQGQFAELRFVLQQSEPNQIVLDGWSGYGVFRQHAGYYWMFHPGVRATLRPEEVERFVEDLKTKRVEPDVVVLDEHLREFSNDLTAFIEAEYREAGVGAIYVRRR